MKLLSSLLYSFGATGLLLLVAPAVQAQTGIGTTSPAASSMLDITSSNRGLLIPRVALANVSDGATIPSPATSLLVFNTSQNIAGPGFYYNSGTSSAPNWQRFVSSSAPVGLDFWRTTGNAGTSVGTHFLGTTDAQDLMFKVANTERFRINRPNGSSNATSVLSADLEVRGKTTMAGDVNVTANSTTNLLDTNVGTASDKGLFTVYGDAFIKGSSKGNNTTSTGLLTIGTAATNGANNNVLALTVNGLSAITGNATVGGTFNVTGNTGLSTVSTSGLASLNTAKVSNLVGNGNRVVVAGPDGTLTTAALVGGTGDYVQNQNSSDQPANFRINGTGQVNSSMSVGTALTVGTTLGVTGASTLNSLGVTTNATVGGSLNVTGGTTTLKALNAGPATLTGTTTISGLTGTGNRYVTVNSANELVAITPPSIPTAANYISNTTTTQSGANFNVSGSGQVGGTFGVTGATTLGGTLGVTGITTLTDLNAGTTKLGATTIVGSLSAGASTLNSATISTALVVNGSTNLNNGLDVIGATKLAGLSAGATTLSSARLSNLTTAGMVINDASGNLTTQQIPVPVESIHNQSNLDQSANFRISGSGRVGSLTVNNDATISGNATVTGALGVSGLSTLGSLGVTTNATISGTLGVTGATSLATLNASGLASVKNAQVTSMTTAGMVVNDANGNLSTVAIPAPGNAILNQNTDDQPANFRINGTGSVASLTVGSALGVSGTSTLASVGVTRNATIGGSLGVSGPTTLTDLSAGNTTLGATSIGGTLSAGASTLNSAIVTNALTVNGGTTINNNLIVTGATSLATLNASGLASVKNAQVTSMTTAGMVVNDANGNLSTVAIPAPGNAILNQNTDDQPANFRINGAGRVNGEMRVGTALSVGTTLGVSGLSTLNSLGVTTDASVSGALTVSGATTLNNSLTVAGNIVPGGNLYNLGAEANRWNIVYANTMFTSNGLVQTSDARLKTNITGLGYGMSTVMAMRPVRYAWKKTPDQTNKIGFIAQELQKVVPEVVSVGTDANQTMGVNYAELVPVLVKALQEQQAQLDTMRGRAEKAEAAVQSFESRLRALEAGSPANATAHSQR